jgi:hypothetical protein
MILMFMKTLWEIENYGRNLQAVLRSSAGLSSPANPASTHAEYPPPMLTIFLNPCVYIFAYYA